MRFLLLFAYYFSNSIHFSALPSYQAVRAPPALLALTIPLVNHPQWARHVHVHIIRKGGLIRTLPSPKRQYYLRSKTRNALAAPRKGLPGGGTARIHYNVHTLRPCLVCGYGDRRSVPFLVKGSSPPTRCVPRLHATAQGAQRIFTLRKFRTETARHPGFC